MSVLDKIEKLEHSADEFGFRWETTVQIMDQIQSECVEINEHLERHQPNPDHLQEEIGDLLHAVFSLCVYCNFNPQVTLEKTVDKFERRLNAVKDLSAQRGLTNLKGHSFEELMDVWKDAKRLVG